MNDEHADKHSPQWKSWALMQVGPNGRPAYYHTPEGDVVESSEVEIGMLWERLYSNRMGLSDGRADQA